jgi:hypothetical protein
MTRRFVRTIWVIAGLVSTLGCAESPASGGDSGSTAYRTTSTIKDIMDSVIDPSADFVWDSVQVVATLQGTEEHAPKTDDDWKAVRRHAISLVEASNLIVMPGRRIARPGEKADDPNVDLPPEEIQKLVDADRDAWVRLAHGLHDAASQTLAAVDNRDVKALLAAGEVLDAACESCHKKYWYPGLNPGQAPGEPGK